MTAAGWLDGPDGGRADARVEAVGNTPRAVDTRRAEAQADSANASPELDATMPSIVLIHGAWAGSWVWDRLCTELAAAGYRTRAVDLPGVGAHAGDPAEATLESHVAAVVAAIDESSRAVLVAHSGGGVIATAVAERMPERIAGVLYVAGIMLPSGLTFAELCDEISVSSPDANGIVPYLEPVHIGADDALPATGGAAGAGGQSGSTPATPATSAAPPTAATVVPPEAGVAVFFNRAPAADAVAASRRLGAWPDTVLSPVVTHTVERFGTVPRVYVEAEFDRSIPLAVQRHMQTRTPGASRLTLPSDHAPQLSSPEQLLAGILSFLETLQT
ncbi:alpha/beta fold hydrolase [Subtercola endophyticus]|uniref:alpha/beta fold hydrolase n=1 Tax=Subtercola endophyticus TaxID=2895559 RepID=UPI001E2D54A2|nr:alpha/beta hydrolase [Subtercola endophyticus]UFS59029.1 alpha/beta hydrolase [Subtercola endophyticus]